MQSQQHQPLYTFVSYGLPPIGEKQIYQYNRVEQNQNWMLWIITLKDLKNQYLTHRKTLYQHYKKTSLVILSNANSSKSSMKKSIQYEIPYVQIHIFTERQKYILQQRILKSMEISHFMNQSFVVYGQILTKKAYSPDDQEFIQPNMLFNDKRTWQQMQIRSDGKGKILFRNGSRVYAQIVIQRIIQFDDQSILESLQIIRNIYYQQRRLRQKQLLRLIQESGSEVFSNRSNSMEINTGVVRMNIQSQTQEISQIQRKRQMEEQQQDRFCQEQIDNNGYRNSFNQSFNDSSDSQHNSSVRSQQSIRDQQVT